VKIPKNEALFTEIYEHACKVTRLAEIIQNDMEISVEEYQEWAKSGLFASNSIKEWMLKVSQHIKANNE
jgi:hypothetical protein